MRLIDVDKLPVTCNVAIINGKLELDGWVSAGRINEAPTVEAIPVEWFEKRMKEINEEMTRLYVEGCYYPKSDDYEKRKNILLRRLAEIKLHGSAYDLVLNEWKVEKENETNRCG